MQKEVKYRINYMKEYMEKIEKGLAEDARAAQDQKEKDRERAWREQEQARLQLNRVEKNGGSSRDSSEEKERKKKKKKQKSRDRSSSNSSDESEKKKKKKKKKKSRTASSGSSDSEADGRNKSKKGGLALNEAELFQMVAELTNKKRKSGSGGEEVLMDLMSKMSDSYGKVKKENAELSARCVVLENKNKVLKRHAAELQEKLDRQESRGAVENRERTREKEERDRERGREDRERERTRERSREREKRSRDRDEGRSRDKEDREREGERRRERQSRFDDDRGRAGENAPRAPPGIPAGANANLEPLGSRRAASRDKNDKIDLQEWAAAPAGQQGILEPGLLSLREKMKAKEAGWRKEEELRSRWVTQEAQQSPEPPQLPVPTEQPLPENRSSVSLSWGRSANKKTPEPGGAGKLPGKAAPTVGKMPWLKRGDSSGRDTGEIPAGQTNGGSAGRRSKFGPPVDPHALPPPGLAAPSLVAPPASRQAEQPGGGYSDHMDQGYSSAPGFPPPPPPALAPPPPGPPSQEQSNMMMMAGYGYGAPPEMPGMPPGMSGMPPPGMPPAPAELVPPPPQPPVPVMAAVAAPPKPVRNPKPQAMDMNAMIAAAQQHMQKNLTAKLHQIGVPMSSFGLPTSQPDVTIPASIPLPGDPTGVDLDIADIVVPGRGGSDIPLPDDDDIAAPDSPAEVEMEDCAPPGEDGEEDDIAPPGKISCETICALLTSV